VVKRDEITDFLNDYLERFGIQALAQLMRKRFEVEVEFIDIPSMV
jgi:putative NIF3 family GTP cyclohydrolase 1 type 2